MTLKDNKNFIEKVYLWNFLTIYFHNGSSVNWLNLAANNLAPSSFSENPLKILHRSYQSLRFLYSERSTPHACNFYQWIMMPSKSFNFANLNWRNIRKKRKISNRRFNASKPFGVFECFIQCFESIDNAWSSMIRLSFCTQSNYWKLINSRSLSSQ